MTTVHSPGGRPADMPPALFGVAGAGIGSGDLAGLIERLPVPVFRSSPGGQILVANAALASLLGVSTVDALLDENATTFYVSSDERRRALARVATEGAVERALIRLRRADGAILWTRQTVHALRDESGRVWALEGVIEDVSELHATAAEKRAMELRFVQAFDGAPIGMALLDRAGSLTRVNHELAALLGCRPGDLDGRPVAAFLDPREEARFHADIAALVRGSSTPLRAERTLLRDGAKPLAAATVLAAVRSDGGRFEAALLHVVDLSRRHAAEQAYRASQARFRNAFEHSPIGMVMTGTRMTAEEVNPALCAMLGLTREEFLATPLRELMHPDDYDASQANFYRVRAGALPPYRVERRMRHKDGHYVPTVLHVAGIADAAGDVTGVLTQVIDRTEQHRAEAELERRQARLESLIRSKDEFLGSVSHELRTPLTTVVGFANELSDRYHEFTEEERRQFVTLIAEQATDMANIVDDLLVAARADQAEVAIHPTPVDMGAEVDAVLEAWPDLVAGRQLEAPAPVAFADPLRLRQILRNLVTNSVRYGGGHVEIHLDAGDGEVSVQIRDDGAGIPEDQWELVFEPYHRAHRTVGQPASVGLGLTVSRMLARRMGGDLRYRHDGTHSVFQLTLPSA